MTTEYTNYHPITEISLTSKPDTIVFVDFESWYWSLKLHHKETPDLAGFVEDVKKRGRIERIQFFGDFTNPSLAQELPRIRTITNDITYCTPSNRGPIKKDFTDFVMLDHIYRTVIDRPQIQQYILVTGDGHFQDVTVYLKNFKDKVIGIYGVQGSISNQLIYSSSWSIEIRPKKEAQRLDATDILLSILKTTTERNTFATFKKTIEIGCSYYKGNQNELHNALQALIDNGYIRRESTISEQGRPMAILKPDWELLTSDKIRSFKQAQ